MAGQMTKDVRKRAQTALLRSPIYALRNLLVEQTTSALVISGRVSSFYHKQLAQEVVRAVADGIEVINSVDVD